MKSDWHRYNLKRRVAQLPTIGLETFLEKVRTAQIDVNLYTVRRSPDEDENGFAVHRRKPAIKQRQLTKKDLKRMARQTQNTTTSSRSTSPARLEVSEFSLGESVHSLATEALEEFEDETDSLSESLDMELDDESTDTEEYDVVAERACIFCNNKFDEFHDVIQHMQQNHGFYIPDQDRCHLEELVAFMWHVIEHYHECLVCGFLGKSIESVQDHVISKGHCRMPFEREEDKQLFAPFYDELPEKDSVKVPEASTALTLPSGTKISHRTKARYYRHKRELQVKQLSLTVLAADHRLQRVNLGGLTRVQYEKLVKQMMRDEARSGRRLPPNRQIGRSNHHKHMVDPNRPGA